MQQQIQRGELPAMPEMSARLLTLRGRPNATIGELTELIEHDPSLAAQLIAYARSAFFGYRGRADTVRETITHVLGFDAALNMALGVAAGRVFRGATDGPLGLYAFWSHAVQTAALSQALCLSLPAARRPKPGLVYLAGLLHDFGFLLMNQLFAPEFTLLNRVVTARPHIPVVLLERRVLGMKYARMNHARLGAWLMEKWEMPPEVIVTLREHHSAGYCGPHAPYVQLVQLADEQLNPLGAAGLAHHETSAAAEALGLGPERVRQTVEAVLSTQAELESMARLMAA